MKPNNIIHPDLITAQKIAYEPLGLKCCKILLDSESQEYAASTFELNNKIIKFRVAKITPTKIGQFVTFWKRIGKGPILPHDILDSFDLLIVSVRKGENLGQFFFTKDILWQKGLLSKDSKGGKRAMRVYPPWDITESPQAKKTQTWQLPYFIEIEPNVNRHKIQKLFLENK